MDVVEDLSFCVDNVNVQTDIYTVLSDFTAKKERFYHNADLIDDQLSNPDQIKDVQHIMELREAITELFFNQQQRTMIVGYIADLGRSKPFPEVQSFALDLIRNNLSTLEDDLNNDDGNSKSKIVDALYSLASNGSYQDSEVVLSVFVEELPRLIDGFSLDYGVDEGPEIYFDVFEYMLHRGNPEQVNSTFQVITDFLYNSDIEPDKRAYIASRLYSSTRPNANSIGKHYVCELIKNANLDENILECWRVGWPEEDEDLDIVGVERYVGVQNNLTRLLQLEHVRPGAVAILRREFGIANFGRYDKDLLLKHIERIDDVSRPYVLIATAQYDDNAESYKEGIVVSRFEKELLDEVNVRFIEFSSPDELLMLLDSLDKRYGDEQKIMMMILFSHGGPRKIATMGTPQTDITREWIMKSGLHNYRGHFSYDAQLVLASCETGIIKREDEDENSVKEEARYVGESFGQIMGLTTIAPELESSLKEIRATKVQGKFEFDVTYSHWDEVTDEVGNKVRKAVEFKGRVLQM